MEEARAALERQARELHVPQTVGEARQAASSGLQAASSRLQALERQAREVEVPRSAEEAKRRISNSISTFLSSDASALAAGCFSAGMAAGVGAGVVLGARLFRSGRLRKFATAQNIPESFFREERTIVGRATHINDGDTFRLTHTPTLNLFGGALPEKAKLSESTIQVRLAGIDTPETAKFGKSGQPFGEEAKLFLTDAIDQQKVRVKLLSRDQYGRVVGEVTRPGFFWNQQPADDMLKRGLGLVYVQSGAVFGKGEAGVKRKAQLLALEEGARAKEVGIWSAEGGGETPAEYKARTR